ncbi:hypothetical protein M5D96_012467, partial [Drosophila gunungcola]
PSRLHTPHATATATATSGFYLIPSNLKSRRERDTAFELMLMLICQHYGLVGRSMGPIEMNGRRVLHFGSFVV